MMGGSRGGPPQPSLAVTSLDALLTLLADPKGAKEQLARLEKARAEAKAATDALVATEQAHDKREAEIEARARAVEQLESQQQQQAESLTTRAAGLDEHQRQLDAAASDLQISPAGAA
jgi:chromosome segregation ATPase